jgi:hypothetical protein
MKAPILSYCFLFATVNCVCMCDAHATFDAQAQPPLRCVGRHACMCVRASERCGRSEFDGWVDGWMGD